MSPMLSVVITAEAAHPVSHSTHCFNLGMIASLGVTMLRLADTHRHGGLHGQ